MQRTAAATILRKIPATDMKLTNEEQAMLAGEMGAVRRWAISHQIAVGEFFDAADFVPVSQAHIMADTESLGEAGVRFLERLAAAPEAERRVRVPTITDPRGIDFAVYRRLGQSDWMAALEQRAIEALRAFGVLMTDTCINYQTIMAPVRGDHLAYGDTGVVIYSNSVLGARSNFEGGPSALAAGLTGRTPRYGYHLDECRRATRRFRLAETPRDLAEWGAVGGIVGEACGSYWEVPVIEGVETVPGSDALKHFGTARPALARWRCFTCRGSPPRTRSSPDRAPPASRSVAPRSRRFSPAMRRRATSSTSSSLAHRNCRCSRSRPWRRRSTGAGSTPTRPCSSRPRPRSSMPPTGWV